MGTLSLGSKSRNWNREVGKLKKQLENTHEGWNFHDLLGFPSTITEPLPVEMKHPSFWGGLCMCPSIPTQDWDARGLYYISIPGSISMTSNIVKNVDAWHRSTSFFFSHVKTLKATTTTKKASKKLAGTSTCLRKRRDILTPNQWEEHHLRIKTWVDPTWTQHCRWIKSSHQPVFTLWTRGL